MKKNKIKIILSSLLFLSVFSFVTLAQAAGPYLYVSPNNLTKNNGESFNLSVGVSSSESKIFAVEGKLVFNNLSCQSISVVSGLIPQVTPTCSNPYFLIGVPSGTTVDKTLLSLSVKAGNSGAASVSFTGVDIIGDGKSLASASVSGNYTVKSNVVTPEPVVVEPKITLDVVNTNTNTNKPVVKSKVAQNTNSNQELVPVENTSTSTTTEEEVKGKVLAGFDEAKQSEQPTSNNKIIWLIVIVVVLIIIFFLGKKMFKKKN